MNVRTGRGYEKWEEIVVIFTNGGFDNLDVWKVEADRGGRSRIFGCGGSGSVNN